MRCGIEKCSSTSTTELVGKKTGGYAMLFWRVVPTVVTYNVSVLIYTPNNSCLSQQKECNIKSGWSTTRIEAVGKNWNHSTEVFMAFKVIMEVDSSGKKKYTHLEILLDNRLVGFCNNI